MVVENDMRPSVLLFASLPPPVAGQSIATKMLLEQLDQAGFEFGVVDIGRPFSNKDDLLARIARGLKVALFPAALLREAARLKGRPIVFYAQIGQSTSALLRDWPNLVIARWMGWPVVGHIHGGGFREAMNRAPAMLRSAVERELRSFRQVIVLSETLRNQVDGLVDRAAISVVPNGVENWLIDRAKCVAERELPGRPFTVLFLSNLIETKGYRVLLRAAAEAERLGCNHRYVFAGNVTETTLMPPGGSEWRVKGVEYVGAVNGEQKARLLAEADALALPSSYRVEGQPIALLEAMHFGLPVITTTIGGIRDVVEDGVNGLLVSPDDSDVLLGAIKKLEQSPGLWRRISMANRSKARLLYTESAHGEAMRRVLSAAARSR